MTVRAYLNRSCRRPTVWVAAAIFVSGAALVSGGVWIKAKAWVAQMLLAQAFLTPAGEPAKPWPWADIEPVARIMAPRLNISNIVLGGVSGEALAFGPGHLPGTAQPGERGTVVYSAHRDTHFSWLGELKPGDEIVVETRNHAKTTYSIRRGWIASADAPGIDTDSDEHLIALTTCWSPDGAQRSELRYIVEGVKVSEEEAGI